jgi:hypothetical protein
MLGLFLGSQEKKRAFAIFFTLLMLGGLALNFVNL